MNQPTNATAEPIYSTFCDDPMLGELVEMYVSEMPERIAALESAFASGDLEALGRAAHQMKGAAGSYGFDTLTPYARTLEFATKEGASIEAIEAALQELVRVCRAVRSGSPAS